MLRGELYREQTVPAAARHVKLAVDRLGMTWGEKPEFKRNKRAGTAQWMMTGRDRSGRWLRIGILWADEDARLLKAIHGLPL